jgi:hypothetical protein
MDCVWHILGEVKIRNNNKPSYSIKEMKFLDNLCKYKPLKKEYLF